MKPECAPCRLIAPQILILKAGFLQYIVIATHDTQKSNPEDVTVLFWWSKGSIWWSTEGFNTLTVSSPCCQTWKHTKCYFLSSRSLRLALWINLLHSFITYYFIEVTTSPFWHSGTNDHKLLCSCQVDMVGCKTFTEFISLIKCTMEVNIMIHVKWLSNTKRM